MQRKSSFGTTLDLLGVLANEIGMATKTLEMVDPSFGVRVLIRVLFSSIDAYCFNLKTRALEGAPVRGITFSKRENEVLVEQREVKSEDGSVRMVKARVGTKRNLLVSIKCFALVRDVDSPLSPSGDLPDNFLKSIEFRNRLTHPKHPDDYSISAEEAQSVANTTQWFMEAITWAKEADLKYIDQVREDIRQSSESLKEKFKKRGSAKEQ